MAPAVGEGLVVGIRDRVKRLEEATEGERTTLVCPECGAEFVVYGDAPLEYLCWERAENSKAETYREIPADVIRLTEHEHDANEFVDKATGEWWLRDMLGSARWEAVGGA